MTTLVGLIDDVFQITGRGCVVTIKLEHFSPDVVLQVGDAVLLRTPDGSEIETVMRGAEMGLRAKAQAVGLLLGPDITKEMVPPGTEIWKR